MDKHSERLLEIRKEAKHRNKNIQELDLDYNNIVFCGMGGSAMPGEVVSSLGLGVPVFKARDYFPKWADENTLCFMVSYSGNTDETLELYKKARRKKCNMVLITSGGQLDRKKSKNIIEKVEVPKGYIPREALPFQLYPILKMLGIKFDMVKNKQVDNCEKIAGKVADKLEEEMPRIYVSNEKMKPIAYRWQTQFNENSKKLAHSHYFPELAHNEIEAREGQAVLMIDKENEQVKRAKKILKPIEIELKGSKDIDKILYGIFIGDLVSYYLAEKRGYDYREMKRIEKLKEEV